MSLNIKNPRTHQLVRDLAEATGQSQTAAVEDAVRRRLAEIRSGGATTTEQHQRHARARRIAQAYRQDLTEQDRERLRTADAWLYDEQGLPR